jgi:ParB family chromosome partitioning protein
MRHDRHYVDNLVVRDGEVVGRMVPMSQVYPNPDQPRLDMGDLEALASSIEIHGVLEPILAIKTDLGYMIVSGERRYRASLSLHKDEIPCIVKNLNEKEILEIALVENLQRQDLHPFEEADCLDTLVGKYHYTHEQVAQKLGRSRSSVTEILTLAKVPDEVRELALQAGITAKTMLLNVAREKSIKAQTALIERIAKGANREDVRRNKPKTGQRATPYIFKFKAPDKTFRMDLKFRRSQVSDQELISCLEQIIADIKNKE